MRRRTVCASSKAPLPRIVVQDQLGVTIYRRYWESQEDFKPDSCRNCYWKQMKRNDSQLANGASTSQIWRAIQCVLGEPQQSVFFFPAIVSTGVVRYVSTRRTALSTCAWRIRNSCCNRGLVQGWLFPSANLKTPISRDNFSWSGGCSFNSCSRNEEERLTTS